MRRSVWLPPLTSHRREVLGVLMLGVTGWLPVSAMADSDFEEGFLKRDKNGASPDVFIYRNAVTPGVKNIDVRLNDRLASHEEILFVSDEKQNVKACLTRNQLEQLGVKVDLYSGWRTAEESAGPVTATQCEDIPARIPAAEVSYDDTQQVLTLTVPQEAVDSRRFTMISPTEWDHGVTSLRTSYNGYFYSSEIKSQGSSSKDETSRSAYINLNSTGTLGAWRLYSIDSFYRNPGEKWESNHDRMYLSRDIAALRSNFQAGEIYTQTSGYMTGAVPLSGVSLATNEQISLDSQFSYSPVIRGVARTNARLIVRQRGNIIYSTTLTPGAFAIDDLYSAQVGADLDVTVEESDGTSQRFHVPYTALPNMIRAGTMRYSLAAGQYRDQNSGSDEPWVATASMDYGFEHFTWNSALLASEDYQFASTGISWNIGAIGAFSTDVAWSQYNETWNDNRSRSGQAARFLYARYFDITDTSLQILGYQYRSRDFREFSEFISRHNYKNDYSSYDDDDWQINDWQHNKRSRIEMNMTQNLEDYGSLYLTLSQDRYYGTDKKTTSISGGVGTNIGPATVSLYWTKNKDFEYNENQVNLSISLPLGSRNTDSRDYGTLNYSLTRDRDNRYSQSMGYSGSVLDNTINYSANVQRSTDNKYSESGTVGYNGSLASVNGGISHSHNYTQYSAGMSGGLTLYGGGLILSPQLNNTVAIIETPDASGIGVSGTNNAKTDYFGHAVVTSLTPYRYNEINLDTSQTEGVELKETARKVVPSDGAAVLLRFATRVGRRAMVEIRSAKTIPLGSMVFIEGEKEEAGIVGTKGMTYLSGLDAKHDQKLNVIWGETKAEQCSFTLPALPGAQQPDEWYEKIVVDCH